MKALTKTQQNLLKVLNEIMQGKEMKYDDIKRKVNFRSFDATFNALYNKGYIERIVENNYDNKFILIKQSWIK